MISLPLLSGGHKADEHGSSNENETVASGWVSAGYTGKDVSIMMVSRTWRMMVYPFKVDTLVLDSIGIQEKTK